MKKANLFLIRAAFYRQMAENPENEWNSSALLSLATMFEDMAHGLRNREAVPELPP